MRFLLDTQAFIWWILDDGRLSIPARIQIEDGRNEIYFSAASAWEIAIKYSIGKLGLPSKPEIFVSEQLALNSFSTLSISVSHALGAAQLPKFHRDPFDRMLVIQSQLENIPIITNDKRIEQYQVKTIW